MPLERTTCHFFILYGHTTAVNKVEIKGPAFEKLMHCCD
jgi:hypothetical protein